jgi:hypothetical protein
MKDFRGASFVVVDIDTTLGKATQRLSATPAEPTSDDRGQLSREMVAYKGGMCQVCGYDRCLRALCFHHLDDATKSFHFAGSHCRSWRALTLELDKCVLLCQNCHAEVHAGLVPLPYSSGVSGRRTVTGVMSS